MSEKNTIQLKISSIQEVPMNTYINDFTFVVNGQEFLTSKIFSDLLSSNICRIHQVDPTFDRMIINTNTRGDFSKFLELNKFTEEEVEESSILFYNEIIEQLGENHFNITGKRNTKSDDKNIFQQINQHSQEGIFSHTKYESDVNEISSKLYEYLGNDRYEEELKKLGYEILYDIIKNDELHLKSEDQLLKFINSIYMEKKEFYQLYEFVIFNNVSSSSMEEFINIFDYNDIDFNIWSSISKRLLKKISKEEEDEKEKEEGNQNQSRYITQENFRDKEEGQITNIEYKERQEFNGIIQYLTKRTRSNIHDNKTIEVSTNSPNGNYYPKNLLDFNQRNIYASQGNAKNAWICFDFKNMKIEISNYSIRSRDYGPGRFHIKNWIFEISEDGNEWTKIDEHSNYTELNGLLITKTFEVSRKQFSRFCRLRNNGEYYGCNDGWALCLDSIEFYGRLQES